MAYVLRHMANKKITAYRSNPQEQSPRVAETASFGAVMPHALIPTLRKGLPVELFERVRERFGVSAEKLAEIIGVAMRTLMRRKQEGRLQMHESERLYRLGRLFDLAVQVFEDVDAAQAWFRSPQKAFAGATPLDYAETELGAREVENQLGRIEHGVFS